MKTIEVIALLSFRQGIEGVAVNADDVRAWKECLDGVSYAKAYAAMVKHYRESTNPLRPAHLIERA